MILKVRRVRESALPLPSYESAGAAGMDLRADVLQAITLEPMERAAVPTGLAVEIPSGFEGQVRPRSGLALKQGLTVLNAPGTIDSDYRGEVQVIMVNLGQRPASIAPGDRIAQLIIAPVTRVELVEVPGLGSTPRGGGGFGHTGR